MTFFFSNFFFYPREISVGAFSGVENAKMWGSSPEMPKTGSPLAKGELVVTLDCPACAAVAALSCVGRARAEEKPHPKPEE
jgi:hypothetical protein